MELIEAFHSGLPALLADGLHPNQSGHRLIAQLVLPRLEGLMEESVRPVPPLIAPLRKDK